MKNIFFIKYLLGHVEYTSDNPPETHQRKTKIYSLIIRKFENIFSTYIKTFRKIRLFWVLKIKKFYEVFLLKYSLPSVSKATLAEMETEKKPNVALCPVNMILGFVFLWVIFFDSYRKRIFRGIVESAFHATKNWR